MRGKIVAPKYFRKDVNLLTLGTAILPFHLSILKIKVMGEGDHFKAKLMLNYLIQL